MEEDGKTFVPDKRDGPITCEFYREEKFFQTYYCHACHKFCRLRSPLPFA